MDGVAREIGDEVYRDDITSKICKEFYTRSPECSHCRKCEEIIDLRGILPTSYSPGDRIIGCLESLGWVVVRGIRIEKETYDAINVISEAGHNGRITKKPYWTSIEERNSKRVIKYKGNSSPHSDWATEINCAKFLEDITTKLLGSILKGSKYIIGKFNLTKNDGVAELDQQAHTDYPPRLAKWVIISSTNYHQ